MKFKMSSTNFKLEDFSWIFSQQLLQNGAAAVFLRPHTCRNVRAGYNRTCTTGTIQDYDLQVLVGTFKKILAICCKVNML